MKNIIIVTGGAGFIGSNLIKHLLKKTRLKRLILGSRSKIINLDYRLDSQNRVDSLNRLDRLDSLNRLDSLDRLDSLNRLDSP